MGFFQAVGAEGFVAALLGGGSQVGQAGAGADLFTKCVVGDEQFVDADLAGESEVVAALAAAGAVEGGEADAAQVELALLRGSRLVGGLAVGAEPADQSTGEDALKR